MDQNIVSRARPRPRHWLVAASFLALVVMPVLVTAWYLYARAADRYVSTVGFSVRTEQEGSSIEVMWGLTELSGSSSSDTDVLYEFLQSQQLVARVDEALDLRTLWSKADPVVDPVFSYHPPGTIEDLVDYWPRMVKVYNDSGSGLIELKVEAFDPKDAQTIATLIFDESTQIINRLSSIAREDGTRYARQELDEAITRLKKAREELTRFRNRTQIVDPEISLQTQQGLLSSLEAQLAQTLIDLDTTLLTTSDDDPRILQFERRVTVIEKLIAKEREKLGLGSDGHAGGASAFADLVGEFESLKVDLTFAEQSYTAALAAYNGSVAEARRQSRYLAAYVQPTLAETAERPQRLLLIALTALFSFLIWSILVLAAFAIKDRR